MLISDRNIGDSSICPATVLIGILVAGACGGQPNGSDSPRTVRDSAGVVIVENRLPSGHPRHLSAEPILTIGDGLPVEQLPLDPVAVFAGADGTILVGDGNRAGWQAVLVYAADGSFLTKFGGAGEGPGEFRGSLSWAASYLGDSIVALDFLGPTARIYGPDGDHSRDISVPRLRPPVPPATYLYRARLHGTFRDGFLLTSTDGVLEVPTVSGPAWYRHLLLAIDPNGVSWDTLTAYRSLQTYWDGGQTAQLFGPSTKAMPYGNDLLLAGNWTYEYRLLGRNGRVRQIVRKAYVGQPIEPADVDVLVGNLLQDARSTGMSEDELVDTRRMLEQYPRAPNLPAYSDVLVAEDLRVWVERYRWHDPLSVPPDPGPSTWDVFSPDGVWLFEVIVPPRIILWSISSDRALGVRIDEMDVKRIVAFALPTP